MVLYQGVPTPCAVGWCWILTLKFLILSCTPPQSWLFSCALCPPCCPQHAIEVLYEETNGEAIITTGVGQHQMWAAQFYKKDQPRQWITSGGLGSMGFGLPSGGWVGAWGVSAWGRERQAEAG